ncbi:hypothetical protein PG995_007654 [Apiospora arundinis]
MCRAVSKGRGAGSDIDPVKGVSDPRVVERRRDGHAGPVLGQLGVGEAAQRKETGAGEDGLCATLWPRFAYFLSTSRMPTDARKLLAPACWPPKKRMTSGCRCKSYSSTFLLHVSTALATEGMRDLLEADVQEPQDRLFQADVPRHQADLALRVPVTARTLSLDPLRKVLRAAGEVELLLDELLQPRLLHHHALAKGERSRAARRENRPVPGHRAGLLFDASSAPPRSRGPSWCIGPNSGPGRPAQPNPDGLVAGVPGCPHPRTGPLSPRLLARAQPDLVGVEPRDAHFGGGLDVPSTRVLHAPAHGLEVDEHVHVFIGRVERELGQDVGVGASHAQLGQDLVDGRRRLDVAAREVVCKIATCRQLVNVFDDVQIRHAETTGKDDRKRPDRNDRQR